MPVYYNEFDANAAAWLRELIRRGLIADGVVDERDLWDIRPDDLRGFTQVHLCAGIGVWSYAARCAGWDDSRSLWTASFPCQPFSQAGKGKGFADERHLWPAGLHLIRECRPAVVIGEQVSSPDGLAWLDLVQADLEGEGYAVGAADTCAAGVGAPHIRQRLYWAATRLADTERIGRERRRSSEESWGRSLEPAIGSRHAGRLADGDDERSQGRGERGDGTTERAAGPSGLAGGLGHVERIGTGRDTGTSVEAQGRAGLRAERDDARSSGAASGMADATSTRHTEARQHERRPSQLSARFAEHGGMGGRPGPTNGAWRAADWLFCRDLKFRPVRPGSFPLVDGASSRVVRLRGYGNAIVAPAAQAWIESYLEAVAPERLRLTSVFD